MEIVCSNCGAQYKLNDGAVPAGGQDVQCANCGHIWFQDGPRAAPLYLDPATQINTKDATESAGLQDQRARVKKPNVSAEIKDILQAEARYSGKNQHSAQRDSQKPAVSDPDGTKAAEFKHLLSSDQVYARVSDAVQAPPASQPEPDFDEHADQSVGNDPHSPLFVNGVLVGVLIVILLFGLYLGSPRLAELMPDSREFFQNIRSAGDGIRIAIQDIYYTGDTPGIKNGIENIITLLNR